MIVLTIGTYQYSIYLGYAPNTASTLAFLMLYFTQFTNLLNLRSFTLSLFKVGFLSNYVIVAGIVASICLQLAAVHWEPLRTALQFENVPSYQVFMIFVISFVVVAGGEIYKLLHRTHTKHAA